MKIIVTYEPTDIARLIKQDLMRQGIPATDADIKYAKGVATVSVEVTPDETVVPVLDVTPRQAAIPPPQVAAPVLEVVEGGANPADMGAIFRESKKIAASTEGKFPTPKHAMLDGESSEWPGDKE